MSLVGDEESERADVIRLSSYDDYCNLYYTAPNGVRITSRADCLTHAYRGRLAMFVAHDTPGAASYRRDEGWAAYLGMRIRIDGFDNQGFNGFHMWGRVEMADTSHPAHNKLISVPLENFRVFEDEPAHAAE